MTIEKLTKDERGWLESDPEYQRWDVRRKVLRIIDAQATENERLRAQQEHGATLEDMRVSANLALATAVGLLTRVQAVLGGGCGALTDDIDAFLASAQPAAPSLGHPGADEVFARLRAARQPAVPARTEADNGWHTPDSIYDAMAVEPARTEGECECSGNALWECPVPGCPARKEGK